MSGKFTHAIPILRVNSLETSLEYYINKLGFKERW
jgi:hypothetical protein